MLERPARRKGIANLARKVTLSEIRIRKRYRREMGDIGGLAASMEELGLTCPFSELRLQLINPSTSPNELNTTLTPHSIIHGDACFAYFNKIWGTPCRTGGLPMHTIILAFVIA